MLSVYGRRHESFGVCGHMFNHMADSFMVAMQPALEDDWNRGMEEAWRTLFRFGEFLSKNSGREQGLPSGLSFSNQD